MSYSLTEEQLMLRDTVRKIAVNEIAPGAAERDEHAKFPHDMVKVLAENGIMGIDFKEEYGGAQMGLLAACIAVEEIAKVCGSTATVLLVHELGSMPLMLAASPEQKEKWMPGLAAGEKLIAFGLTEPGAGSDAGALKTRAVLDGDHYVVNGRKCFISHGDVADYITLAVRTGDGPASKSLSMLCVEKGTPGFTIGKKEEKMGIRGSSTVELIFEDALVPAENLVGLEGQGFSILMKTLDFTRIPVAAQALGLAQGAFDFALKYAKEREQFGKPIFTFQGLQWMLADMATQTESARQLVYKAASEYEALPKDMQRVPEELVRYSAMAKLHAAETAMRVTTDAVQVLGGYGFTKEYPVERMMRDAKITQIYEGTSQVQKIVIGATL